MHNSRAVYTNNGRMEVDRYGQPVTIWDSKRYLVPHKSCPYASQRQTVRQQVNFGRALMKRILRGHKPY